MTGGIFARWADTHPAKVALVSVAVFAGYFVFVGLTSGTSLGHGQMQKDLAHYAASLWPQAALAFTALGIVFLAGWMRPARITTSVQLSGLIWLAPTLCLLAILLAFAFTSGNGSFVLDPETAWKACLLFLLVGVFEEILFRGILMHGLTQRFGPVIALFASSGIFGTMHFVNWIEGQPLDGTAQQVLHASASGLLYGAIVLRTGSIWPAVFLHAIWDASIAFSAEMMAALPKGPPEDTSLIASGFFVLFDAVVGLLVLRSYLRQQPRINEGARR